MPITINIPCSDPEKTEEKVRVHLPFDVCATSLHGGVCCYLGADPKIKFNDETHVVPDGAAAVLGFHHGHGNRTCTKYVHGPEMSHSY